MQIKLKISKALPKKKSGGYKELIQIKSEFFEKRFQISYFPAGSDGKENREQVPPSNAAIAKPTLPTFSALRSAQTVAQENDRSESPDSLDTRPRCLPADAIRAYEETLELKSQLSQLRIQHESDVRARDFQIATLKARVERSSAEIEEWRRVASEGEQFKARAQELTEQNRDLISRLEDRDEKIISIEREGKHLERLRQEIFSAVPDLQGIVEMVTAREREEREERDRKVLRILKGKDVKITELQGENSGFSRVVAQLRLQLEQVETANKELSRELESTIQTREEQIRELRSALAEERERTASLRRSVDDLRQDGGDMDSLKQQISELIKQASEAEKVRVRLESDVEELLRERTERESRLVQVEEKEREWKGQERKFASMQRQLQEQSDQIDCLISELSSRNGGEVPVAFAALSSVRGLGRSTDGESVAELKEQVFSNLFLFRPFPS